MQKRKRFNKVAAVCISALIAVQPICFAESGITVSQNGNSVTISHSVQGGDNGTFIYVFDTKVEESTVINDAFVKEHLVYVTQSAESSVGFTLPSDADYGIYTVLLGAEGLPSAKTDRMAYMFRTNPTELEEALAAINGSESAQELYDNLAAYNDIMYVVDLKAVSANKSNMYALLSSGIPNGGITSVEDIETLIDKAKVIGGFSTYGAAELESALKDNPDLFETNADFDSCSAETAAILLNMRNNGTSLTTVEEINTAVYEATALAVVNKAGAGTVLSKLEKYNDLFGVDFDGTRYKKISKTELGKLLDYETFMSKEAVKKTFNDSVDKLYEELSDKKQTSSGGGGGGGGGTGGKASSIVPVTVDKSMTTQLGGGADTSYTDIEGYGWANAAIEYLRENEIMSGDGDGKFRPGAAIKREEFVKILMTGFKYKPSDENCSFEDVPADSWFKPYVALAVSLETVKGIDDTKFGTGMQLTRQDAAVLIYRMLQFAEIEPAKKHTLVEITDLNDIADYAKEAVDYLLRCGVLSGFEDGSFKPKQPITRAEAAKIIFECVNGL